MKPKQFLVFRESFTGNLVTYKWNEKEQWWLLEDGSGNGFSLEKVNQYKDGGCFTQFDTREEVEEHLRYMKYVREHGVRVKNYYDFKCPKCDYHHTDDRDYEGYSGDMPEDTFTLKCYCGHLIKISPKLVYEVE